MTSCGEKQIESDLTKTIKGVCLRLHEFRSALVYKEVLNARRYQMLFLSPIVLGRCIHGYLYVHRLSSVHLVWHERLTYQLEIRIVF